MGKRPAITLGSIIRRQRELADLTMRQVAESVGISNPYLSQIERGLRAPSDAVLRAIAGRLDTNMDYLYAMAGYIEPANDEPTSDEAAESGLLRAIKDAHELSAAQRRAMAEIYTSFVDSNLVRRHRDSTTG